MEEPRQKRPRGQRGGKNQKEPWKRTEEGLRVPSSGRRSEKPNFGSQRHSVVEPAHSDWNAGASSSAHTAPQDLASQVSRPAQPAVVDERWDEVPEAAQEEIPEEAPLRSTAASSSGRRGQAHTSLGGPIVGLDQVELRVFFGFHGVLDLERAGGHSQEAIPHCNELAIKDYLIRGYKCVLTWSFRMSQ